MIHVHYIVVLLTKRFLEFARPVELTLLLLDLIRKTIEKDVYKGMTINIVLIRTVYYVCYLYAKYYIKGFEKRINKIVE